MTEKRKHEMFVWGGVIGGVVILYAVFLPHTKQRAETNNLRSQNRTNTPSKMPMSSHPTTSPNPQQGTLDEAFLAARTQALAMYDQTVLGEQTNEDQLTATNNETAAAKAIAFNQDSTQYKLGALETTAAEQAAQEQYQAEENVAQQETQAYQSSQPQWWQYLLGGLGSIGSMFGFSNVLGGGGFGTSGLGFGTTPTVSSPPNVQSPIGWNVVA